MKMLNFYGEFKFWNMNRCTLTSPACLFCFSITREMLAGEQAAQMREFPFKFSDKNRFSSRVESFRLFVHRLSIETWQLLIIFIDTVTSVLSFTLFTHPFNVLNKHETQGKLLKMKKIFLQKYHEMRAKIFRVRTRWNSETISEHKSFTRVFSMLQHQKHNVQCFNSLCLCFDRMFC